MILLELQIRFLEFDLISMTTIYNKLGEIVEIGITRVIYTPIILLILDIHILYAIHIHFLRLFFLFCRYFLFYCAM